MNEIQIFDYKGNKVRTVEKDGVTWWVLKDVCNVLEMKDNSAGEVVKRLDKDEYDSIGVTDNLGRQQNTYIVNESGLYNVILRSDKEEAKPFRKWVTGEVLPSIRKHGAYMTPEKLKEVILNPDTMIELCIALKDEQDKNKALQAINSKLTVDNQIMQPKADYFDELVDRNLLTSFRDTAKELDVKEKEFIKFLIEKKYIYKDKKGKLMPYADKNNGLFEVKECYNEKTNWSGSQTLITPKGRETFRLLFLKVS